MDRTALTAFDTLIRARLAEIEAEDAAQADDRRPVELDQQSVGRLSRIDAMQVQAMAIAQSRRRALQRQRLTAALARLAAGDFGFCENCGEQIALRRLELDPAHTRCIDCAAG
ncbi:MAG: TraR/DksA C4-type zinc finger protein [Pseudomonadota bacterium]